MAKITRLVRQQHDDCRVSVFLDGEYAFSVSESTVAEERLCVGTELDTERCNGLLQEDEKKRAFSKGAAAVARSAKTVQQVRAYLESKEFSPAAVEAAIEKLERIGWLNDEEFCRNYAETHPSRGVRDLKAKLRMKGVPESIAEAVLQEIPEDAQKEAAQKLLERQRRKVETLPPRERRAKLTAFLARRGYSWDVIASVVKEDDE